MVSVDRLGELVWGEETASTLRPCSRWCSVCVSGFEASIWSIGHPATCSGLPDDHVDVGRFESLVLDATARRAEDPERACQLLDDALRLWRGEPFDDLVDADDGRIEIDRLTELRCRAREERFELQLGSRRSLRSDRRRWRPSPPRSRCVSVPDTC